MKAKKHMQINEYPLSQSVQRHVFRKAESFLQRKKERERQKLSNGPAVSRSLEREVYGNACAKTNTASRISELCHFTEPRPGHKHSLVKDRERENAYEREKERE